MVLFAFLALLAFFYLNGIRTLIVLYYSTELAYLQSHVFDSPKNAQFKGRDITIVPKNRFVFWFYAWSLTQFPKLNLINLLTWVILIIPTIIIGFFELFGTFTLPKEPTEEQNLRYVNMYAKVFNSFENHKEDFLSAFMYHSQNFLKNGFSYKRYKTIHHSFTEFFRLMKDLKELEQRDTSTKEERIRLVADVLDGCEKELASEVDKLRSIEK